MLIALTVRMVLKWECRRRINSKRHKVEMSVRAGSWFAQSKMTLEEILEYTYSVLVVTEFRSSVNKTRTWSRNIHRRGLGQFQVGRCVKSRLWKKVRA